MYLKHVLTRDLRQLCITAWRANAYHAFKGSVVEIVNIFFRFRFRLLSSYGSGTGSGSDSIEHKKQIFQQKFWKKSCLFTLEKMS